MKPEKARQLAFSQAEKVQHQKGENPYVTFSSMEFNFPQDQVIPQSIIARQNLELDPQSCLGRVAVTAAIMQQCHPESTLEFGEVLDDFFRNILLDRLKQYPVFGLDDGFMQELLMYEEPHAVVMVDGQQFEPLSIEYGEFVTHAKVEIFPNIWNAIAASATVSEAWWAKDPGEKLRILKIAASLCPGLTLVQENIVGALVMLDDVVSAISILEQLLKRRPCARSLYTAYLLTDMNSFREELVGTYTEHIIEQMISEVGEEVFTK
jgi:hypothetical protein